MEEIKVGEYVRTTDGIIDQIEEFDFTLNLYHCKRGMCIDKLNKIGTPLTNIVKHSPNIIDLIEENDLVEIEYYSRKYRGRITRVFVGEFVGKGAVTFYNAHTRLYIFYYKWSENKKYKPKIKTILTKEQYTVNCYEVK